MAITTYLSIITSNANELSASIKIWMNEEDMIHPYNGIFLGHTKQWSLSICDNMDGPRGYYAKWNRSERQRKMPRDFTCRWNLKNKINEQARQKHNHRYREQIDGCQLRES